jgi:hypothetical protein
MRELEHGRRCTPGDPAAGCAHLRRGRGITETSGASRGSFALTCRAIAQCGDRYECIRNSGTRRGRGWNLGHLSAKPDGVEVPESGW